VNLRGKGTRCHSVVAPGSAVRAVWQAATLSDKRFGWGNLARPDAGPNLDLIRVPSFASSCLQVVPATAGRGCPAATHFSLSRQRKVSKRKATLLSASPLRWRCEGKPAVLGPAGAGLELAALRQSPVLIRPDLRSSAHTEGWWDLDRISDSGGDALCATPPPRIRIHCPTRRAGPRSAAENGSGRAILSEASRARPRFRRAPQVAPERKRRGSRPSGRLFFGDFLLAKQKKVTCRRATPG